MLRCGASLAARARRRRRSEEGARAAARSHCIAFLMSRIAGTSTGIEGRRVSQSINVARTAKKDRTRATYLFVLSCIASLCFVNARVAGLSRRRFWILVDRCSVAGLAARGKNPRCCVPARMARVASQASVAAPTALSLQIAYLSEASFLLRESAPTIGAELGHRAVALAAGSPLPRPHCAACGACVVVGETCTVRPRSTKGEAPQLRTRCTRCGHTVRCCYCRPAAGADTQRRRPRGWLCAARKRLGLPGRLRSRLCLQLRLRPLLRLE